MLVSAPVCCRLQFFYYIAGDLGPVPTIRVRSTHPPLVNGSSLFCLLRPKGGSVFGLHQRRFRLCLWLFSAWENLQYRNTEQPESSLQRHSRNQRCPKCAQRGGLQQFECHLFLLLHRQYSILPWNRSMDHFKDWMGA